MSNADTFRITRVTAHEACRLHLAFGDGYAADVDLSKIIRNYSALKSLRDAKLFRKARVGEHGHCVTWGTDALELAADNLRAEAVEQAGGISHERVWDWMHSHGLTLNTAADALGMSRRMLAYYRSGAKPVPRTVWLACIGWAAQRRKAA